MSRTKFGPLVLSGGSKFLVPTYLTAWLLGILRRDECHRLEPLSGREERHDDHLQDRDGSVEGVRLEQFLLHVEHYEMCTSCIQVEMWTLTG